MRLVLMAFALCVAGSAGASGIYRAEQSVLALGSANAGAGARQDSPALAFFNPSAVPMESATVAVDFSSFQPDQIVDQFIPVTSPSPLSLVGQNTLEDASYTSGFFSVPVKAGWAIGVGMNTPYAASLAYSPASPGALDALKNRLEVREQTLFSAMELSDTVRVGLSVIFQDLDLSRDRALSTGGMSEMVGESSEQGFTLGTQVQVNDAVRLGFSYRSEMRHEISGTTKLSSPLPISETVQLPIGSYSTQSTLLLPTRWDFSFVSEISPALTLLGQFSHHAWGDMATQPTVIDVFGTSMTLLSTERYEDVQTYSIGFEYQPTLDWSLRGGVGTEPASVVSGTETFGFPDGDKQIWALGVSKRFGEHVSIDGAWNRVVSDEVQIQPTVSVPFSAVAQAEYDVMAIGLRYHF